MITESYTLQKKLPLFMIRQKRLKEPIALTFDDSCSNVSGSQKLSFKGSAPVKSFNNIKVSDAIKKFGEIFGDSAKKHLAERIDDAQKYYNQTGLKVEKDIISFKQTTLGKRLLDIVLYPITKMSLDIANSLLKGLKKIPGLKQSKTIDKMLNNKTLTERREFIKHTSDIAAIEHYFEQISQKTKKILDDKTKKEIEVPITSEEIDKNLFDIVHKRFKPLVSHYDTTTERTITRIVTGMIPAFYLANDAYNLSIYMKNDEKNADKDKKRRFNQETARIAITAGLTYGGLSLFSKHSNSSAFATTMLLSGITLISEFVGRVMSGTPVFPVSKKQAVKYAELQDRMYNKQNNEDNRSDSTANFKGFEGKKQYLEHKQAPETGVLTIKNILKAMGILAIAGLGIEKGIKIKAVKKVLDNINKKYKKFSEKEFKISRKEFKDLTQKLRANGFNKIADNYEDVVKNQQGDEILLGNTKDKTKNMLVHNGLLFPVRFIWDTLMMPYKSILKPVWNIITRHKEAEKAVDANKKAVERVRESIQFLQKLDKNKPYKDQINKNILSSLDNVTKSNYSNADLASISKIAVSGVTSIFLIADNYNQVMVESHGENKPLAEQKAKERTIQRALRIAYGAFVVKLFNGMFANAYNSSLLGAQMVNVGSTIVTESVERRAVGLPIGESSRDEIVQKEKENLNAKGIKGGYFRLMAKLTGKRSLSEEAAIKDKK